MTILKLPNILTIQLKRFDYLNSNWFGGKFNKYDYYLLVIRR